MALDSIFAKFDPLHRDLRAMEAEMLSPAPLSLTLLALHDKRRDLASLATEMEEALAELSAQIAWADPAEAARDVSYQASLPTADANSPLTKWAREPAEALMPKLEELKESEKARLEKLGARIEELITGYSEDEQKLGSARMLAEKGEYTQAGEITKGLKQHYKGIAYYQVDLAIAKWPKLVQMLRSKYEERRGSFERDLAEVERKPMLFTPALESEAHRRLKEVGESAESERLRNGQIAGSEAGLALDRVAEEIAAWQKTQETRLVAAGDRARRLRRRQMMLIPSCIAALLIVVVGVLFYLTGYRVAGPDGEVQLSRFLFPGEHKVTVQLANYQPMTALVPVSFLSVTERRIDAAEMQRLTGSAQLSTDPAGAAVILEGEGDLAGTTFRGTTPASFPSLPVGVYRITYKLGSFNATGELKIETGPAATSSRVLPVGTLSVTTQPVGATVLLGDRTLGKTPLTINGMDPGYYQITLQLGDYSTGVPVTVAAGKVAAINHSFGYGRLIINSDPPGADVRFLGAGLKGGKTPLTVDSALARDYEFEVTYPNLAPVRRKAQVQRDQELSVEVKLAYARLEIASQPPGARVIFSAEKLPEGKTPYLGEFVPPGPYTTEVSYGKGTAKQQTVQLEAGQTAKLDFSFPRGHLRVTSDPPGMTVSLPGSGVAGGKTPLDLGEIVAGKYSVVVTNGELVKMRHTEIEPGGDVSMNFRFLKSMLASSTPYPKYIDDNFPSDTVVEEGGGLTNAKIGGPIEDTLKKFGIPDRISQVPDATEGALELLAYTRHGFSIITDGSKIKSLTFTPVRNSQSGAHYWARMRSGIGIGSSMDDVKARYGNPIEIRETNLIYPGVIFFIAFTDAGSTVSTMRVVEKPPGEPEPAAGR